MPRSKKRSEVRDPRNSAWQEKDELTGPPASALMRRFFDDAVAQEKLVAARLVGSDDYTAAFYPETFDATVVHGSATDGSPVTLQTCDVMEWLAPT